MEQGVVPLITHTASGRRLTRLNVVICQEAINAQLIAANKMMTTRRVK